MNRYLLVWMTNEPGEYKIVDKQAQNKEHLLKNMPEEVLDKEWTIYQISDAVTKETLVHGGNYDHVLPE